jgi:hypothetical protein
MARRALQQALGDSKPHSLSAVADELGYSNASSLHRRFPDLCRALVTKNKNWREQEHQRIQNAIIRALQEKPPPMTRELAARLGYRAGELRRHFPTSCAALAARLPERQAFERECIRQKLEAAVDWNPAPPMKVVAQFIGRDQTY